MKHVIIHGASSAAIADAESGADSDLARDAGAPQVDATSRARAPVIQWLPVALNMALLLLLLTHLAIVSWFLDPRVEFWAILHRHGTSFYLWQRDGHLSIARWTVVVLALGPAFWLLGRWLPTLRRPARVVCLIGAASALVLPLASPWYWELGLGLPTWTWGLPVRLAAIAVAMAATLLLLRPAYRWPRWVLAVGAASLGLLLLVPQPAKLHQPQSLMYYCDWLGARCDKLPPACHGRRYLPATASTVPVSRIVDSIPIRAKARARIEDRLEDLRRGIKPDISVGWIGLEPPKIRIQASSNALLYLWWQEVRLLCLGLLLLVGLPLAVWLLLRRERRPHWPLAAFVALLAVVVASAVLPEWARISLAAHLPSALLLPLAVVSVAVGLRG